MSKFLSGIERFDLKRAHRQSKRKRDADRIKCILLMDSGYTYDQIAEVLLIDKDTITSWKKRFEYGGMEALLDDNYQGGLSYLDETQQVELSRHLESEVFSNCREVCDYIYKTYGVAYSVAGVRDLLKRLGFVYKKPKHIPGKADQAKQEAFVEAYQEMKEQLSPEDQVYFGDAVHPMHNSQPAFGWFKKGKEQGLKSNNGRQRININGMYCVQTQRVVIDEADTINAQSTIRLVKKLVKIQKSGIIHIILDNAGYNRSRLLKEFLENHSRVKIHYLPPYSPNLNLIERLWGFYRRNITHNRYYEKFAEFRQVTIDFFKGLYRQKKKLKRLMNEQFQVLPV